MVSELIKKCRSFRRFNQDKRISFEQLYDIASNARYTPSAANLQRLRFALFTEEGDCNKIFSGLRFAGYLTEWSGPADSERPCAYIVIASECELDFNLAIDLGICAEAILLSATEREMGGCIFRSFNAEGLASLLPTGLVPHVVIALGYPSEEVVIVDSKSGEIKYFRDSEDRHVVPKLPLDKIII